MRYTSISLSDGKQVAFEMDAISGPQPVSKLGETIEDARDTITKSLQGIREFTEGLLNELRVGLAEAAPDNVKVTFGVKLSAELGGFLVAKAGGEAHYSVTLSWTTRPPHTAGNQNARTGSHSDTASSG